MGPAPLRVEAAEWLLAMTGLRDRGFAYLDFLTVIDRIDVLEYVAHVVDVDSGEHLLVTAVQPSATAAIDSLCGPFPGANWHEREAAEMFGVVFIGHPDPRPLLVHGKPSRPPLRKATALGRRRAKTWPGAADDGASGRKAAGRRRQRVPGVLDTWVEEES